MEASLSNQRMASVRIQLAVSAGKFTLASLREGMKRDRPDSNRVWCRQSPDLSLAYFSTRLLWHFLKTSSPRILQTLAAQVLEAGLQYRIYDVPYVWLQPKQLFSAFPTMGLARGREDKHMGKGVKQWVWIWKTGSPSLVRALVSLLSGSNPNLPSGDHASILSSPLPMDDVSVQVMRSGMAVNSYMICICYSLYLLQHLETSSLKEGESPS